LLLLLFAVPVAAFAQDAVAPATPAAAPSTPPVEAAAAAPAIDTGDTAWVLASTALVLLMTPGLALFYGGMVRGKNVLNMLMKSFIAIALVSVLWMIIGYSLAFAPGSAFLGDLRYMGLNNVGQEPLTLNGTAMTVPHQVFMVFQLMFAIITPALISGRGRRAHEVFGVRAVHRAVEPADLFAARPHGVGRGRLFVQPGRARLCRRHRRAYLVGRERACAVYPAGQAPHRAQRGPAPA
jgi:hypothetical protein